ncbi:hypothetical protein ABMY36_09540 [Vibrio vulnificus]|uniref:hypothetical protein n=1 Tax=Vibrio vulnificus TaxID=672 RepID=UPI004058BA63
MQHNKMPSNHQSNVAKKVSENQIELRFKLMKAISKKKHSIKITEEIMMAMESDKALLAFSGVVDGVSLECGMNKFHPITRNTVKSHGKLPRIQLLRKEALSNLLYRENSDEAPTISKNKTVKAEEQEELKLQVQSLNSDLASLRSAYRDLLQAVKNKLPFDPDIESIVRLHNQSSIMRKGVSMKVVK